MARFVVPPIPRVVDRQVSNGDARIRTFPDLIRFNAENNPEHTFCVQAEKQSDGLGLRRITCLELIHSVAKCSQWLKDNVARTEAGNTSTVALLMDSDIGILLHLFALMSLGMPVVLLSARLSAPTIQHLLAETSTKAIVVSPRLTAAAQEATAGADVQICAAQSYSEYFTECNSSEPPPALPDGDYEHLSDRNVLILHSSGSTGLPKPIYTSHDYLLSYATCYQFDLEHQALGLNVTTLPLYHGFGLVAPALSLGCGKTFTALPSFTVPNGLSTVELINLTNARSLMSVPTILEDICQLPHPHGIEALRRLDFVGCGGGPLKRVTGECLAAAGVRVVNSFGTTETGPLSVMFVPGPDYDWHFFRMRTDLNIELIRVPGGEREDDDAAAKQYHLRVVPPGWTTPFDVQDRLVTNPRHSMTDFRPVGRSDDLIVLATGEKVLASALAAAISEAENVGAVAVFGEGQPQVGVLVEAAPASLAENVDDFKSLIWRHIESVNDRVDEHARILSRDLIVVVPSGLSLPRSDKGAVLGKQACALFEQEILDAYRRLEDGAVADDVDLVFSVENLKAGLLDMVLHRLRWKTKPQGLAPDADLFELGMDSVQATHLRRMILAAAREIPNAAQTVGRDFVYLHPSVAQMADALKHGGEDATVRSGQRQMLESFVNKYKANEPRCVVFLTGSTGSLGTHLLAHLAGLPEVSKIVCYNRPSPTGVHPKGRLQKALTEKRIGIPQAHWEKISVLEGRASQPRLGLDEDMYFSLCCTVTHIVHNAWPMDFRRPLASFEPQFAALRNLLELAKSAAARRPGSLLVAPSRFLFVSSIAVVGNYAATHGGRLVPEASVDAESCIGSLGYGQAKFVCEKIIEQSEAAGVEAMYVRVGQMSGSSKSGYWNAEEHFPALLRTAQQLGTLPVIPGTFSWLPADYAAAAIAELAFSSKPVCGAYHLENPIRQSWHDLMQDLTPQLGLSHLNHVPYADWLAQLRDLRDIDAEESPAKKLEAFFERDFVRMSGGEVVMDTSRMRTVSGTLRSMDVIRPKLIERYVAYWRSIAFLA